MVNRKINSSTILIISYIVILVLLSFFVFTNSTFDILLNPAYLEFIIGPLIIAFATLIVFAARIFEILAFIIIIIAGFVVGIFYLSALSAYAIPSPALTNMQIETGLFFALILLSLVLIFLRMRKKI